MYRVAFAGSATNPSHLGHTWILEVILSLGIYDQVIWYPSGFSDKPGMDPQMGIHRQQLAHLAFPQEWIHSPRPGWSPLLLDLSATMQKDVPTITRFRRLRRQYPGAEISFITGSDAVSLKWPNIPRPGHLTNWYQSEQLMKKPIRIIPREGFAWQNVLELPGNGNIQWLTERISPNIQSSRIRQYIAEGDMKWLTMVNERVANYIRLHGLYKTKDCDDQ
ncbi:MAG: hypothetical protein M3Q81_01125 [bacterium]|nr:hypothetical protein [bacterium]